jgi:hypothetical protein
VIAQVTIRLMTDPASHIEVAGLPDDLASRFAATIPDDTAWQGILALYVARDGDQAASPVLGEYAVNRDRIIFTPRFPLKPGLNYRAVFDPDKLPGKPSPGLQRVETIISMPAPSRRKPTIVEAVFPSSEVLPENQLKFYIHFSQAMRRGDSYRHIRLLDAKQKPVDAPFLELAEELWDEAGTRLTLLLDPGRVKQDLKPHKDVGRALVEGHDYTLLIDAAWRDAHGTPLGSEFRKSFHVTREDVRQPDPRRWKLSPPRAATREPLVVQFDEPLDHAMLQRVIRVGDLKNRLEGRTTVDRHETIWKFRPAKPWSAGRHRLLIDPTLEDRAGNSLERPFEVVLPSPRPIHSVPQTVEFEVQSK